MNDFDHEWLARPLHNGAVQEAPLPRTKKPKVSVMLITYNHGRYIAQALDSVLMQKTNFHFTINVIEDCSTDNTANIVRDYAARYPDRVIPFLNEKNIGFKVTQRNFMRGFRTLDGEYFAILEGDDYWTSPDKLQKQVDFLDQNPDFAICAHNTIKMYEDGSQEPHRFLYNGQKDDGTIEDAIMLRNFFHTTGVLYRNVFNGQPPRQYISKWSCDIFIFISHAAFGKIHHIDEDMAVYRAHPAGRFSTMSKLNGWKFNIGGLQRYNAWLGFRYMRTFARSIIKYCNIILNESGKDGVAKLGPFSRLKYIFIKYFYIFIYSIFDIRSQFRRAFILDSFSLRDDFERYSHFTKAAYQTLEAISLKKRILSVVDPMLRTSTSSVCLPRILAFGPHPVVRRCPFNVQGNGQSAIWMRVESPPPAHTVIIFGGKPLDTVVDKDLVTAQVPGRLTAKPGKIPIWLEAEDRKAMIVSQPVYFTVLDAPQVVAASIPPA